MPTQSNSSRSGRVFLMVRSVKRSALRRLVNATCLAYYGGIGDHLLLSTLARELKQRGCRYVFIISDYPDLFRGNADINRVARPGSNLAWAFMKMAGERTIHPTYLINHDRSADTRVLPPDPAVAYMCRMAGITGQIALRPYMHLSEAELAWGARFQGCIALQSTGRSALFPAPNKEWYPERFAEVAAHLIRSHPVVQIGSPSDPPVPATYDLRGQTSLRQLAALLAHCRILVGLEGMPMHMARAVECPSVIVYGGRLRPDQIGYICNENLYTPIHCAPCWQDWRCDFGRACMDSITVRDVSEAVERLLSRPREGLAVESYAIV